MSKIGGKTNKAGGESNLAVKGKSEKGEQHTIKDPSAVTISSGIDNSSIAKEKDSIAAISTSRTSSNISISRGQTVIALMGGIDRSKTYFVRKEPLSEDQIQKLKDMFGDMLNLEETDEEETGGLKLSNTPKSKPKNIQRKNAQSRKVAGTIDAEANAEMLNMLKTQFGFSLDHNVSHSFC